MQDKMKKRDEREDKEKARYTKNYDACLRKQSEMMHEDDYVYLGADRNNIKCERHKLTTIDKGRHIVLKVDKNTIVIEKKGQYVKKVSPLRIILVPKTQIKK